MDLVAVSAVREAQFEDIENAGLVDIRIELNFPIGTSFNRKGSYEAMTLASGKSGADIVPAREDTGGMVLHDRAHIEAFDGPLRRVLPGPQSVFFRDAAFVEEPFTLTSDERVEAAPPEIVEASNSRIVINTRARDVRFLVLSDVYYPGWIASIDGHETKVFRADYALRGIAVPAGPHEVVFEYRPLSFYVGLTIGMAGIVVLLAIALRMRRSNKSP